jgi:hypothetical protein
VQDCGELTIEEALNIHAALGHALDAYDAAS